VKITGRVTDERGSPIAGAKVGIFLGETDIAGLTSAENGRFEFSTATEYPSQALKAVVVREGFKTLKQEIRPGEDADLILTPEVRVPDVINKPYADAVVELSEKNLRAVESKTNGGPPWNTVISQSPMPGQFVNPGTTVTLTVHGSQAKTFPWWIVIIVLVLVGGGVITWTVAERAQREAEVKASVSAFLARERERREAAERAAAAGADFKGGWRNINSSTGGITRVVITNENDRFAIHAWGRCHPTDCDWGIAPAKVEPQGTSQPVTSLSAVWNQGFVQRFMTVTLFRGAQPRLKIRTASHYTDNSGRPENQMEEDFEKGG
jgi:hypothetical protein